MRIPERLCFEKKSSHGNFSGGACALSPSLMLAALRTPYNSVRTDFGDPLTRDLTLVGLRPFARTAMGITVPSLKRCKVRLVPTTAEG